MSVEKTNSGDTASSATWEHGSDDRFTAYYAQSSLSEATRERFTALAEKILRMLPENTAKRSLEVADIGCGPGAQVPRVRRVPRKKESPKTDTHYI